MSSMRAFALRLALATVLALATLPLLRSTTGTQGY